MKKIMLFFFILVLIPLCYAYTPVTNFVYNYTEILYYQDFETSYQPFVYLFEGCTEFDETSPLLINGTYDNISNTNIETHVFGINTSCSASGKPTLMASFNSSFSPYRQQSYIDSWMCNNGWGTWWTLPLYYPCLFFQVNFTNTTLYRSIYDYSVLQFNFFSNVNVSSQGFNVKLMNRYDKNTYVEVIFQNINQKIYIIPSEAYQNDGDLVLFESCTITYNSDLKNRNNEFTLLMDFYSKHYQAYLNGVSTNCINKTMKIDNFGAINLTYYIDLKKDVSGVIFLDNFFVGSVNSINGNPLNPIQVKGFEDVTKTKLYQDMQSSMEDLGYSSTGSFYMYGFSIFGLMCVLFLVVMSKYNIMNYFLFYIVMGIVGFILMLLKALPPIFIFIYVVFGLIISLISLKSHHDETT